MQLLACGAIDVWEALIGMWRICLTSSNPRDQCIIHPIWTKLSLPYKMFACTSTHWCNGLIHSSRCSWCLQSQGGWALCGEGLTLRSSEHSQSRCTVYRDMGVLSPRYLKEVQSQFELENEKHVHMELFSRFSCLFACFNQQCSYPSKSWQDLCASLAYTAINIINAIVNSFSSINGNLHHLWESVACHWQKFSSFLWLLHVLIKTQMRRRCRNKQYHI